MNAQLRWSARDASSVWMGGGGGGGTRAADEVRPVASPSMLLLLRRNDLPTALSRFTVSGAFATEILLMLAVPSRRSRSAQLILPVSSSSTFPTSSGSVCGQTASRKRRSVLLIRLAIALKKGDTSQSVKVAQRFALYRYMYRSYPNFNLCVFQKKSSKDPGSEHCKSVSGTISIVHRAIALRQKDPYVAYCIEKRAQSRCVCSWSWHRSWSISARSSRKTWEVTPPGECAIRLRHHGALSLASRRLQ